MQRNPYNITGILLVVIGVLLLIGNFTTLDPGKYWPVFLILTGIFFFGQYLSDSSKKGYLMVFGILITIGGLFLYTSLTDWNRMESLWPIFIAAPGIGFFCMYLSGSPDRQSLFPGAILFASAAALAVITTGGSIFWSVVMMLAGFLLIVRRRS